MCEPAPILARMFEVCFGAVKWLTSSLSPICLSDSPAATRWRTVNSRKVSPLGVLFGGGAAAAPGARLRHDLRQHGQQVIHLLVRVVGPDSEA